MEVDMVVKGLSDYIVKALEVIFLELDNNRIFRAVQNDGPEDDDGYPGDGEIPSYIVQGFMALLMFSTEDNPDRDDGTGFYKLLLAASNKHRPQYQPVGSRRKSVATLMKTSGSRLRLYNKKENKNIDLLTAMANFDCDDSNTIRFAEFANGYRKFREIGKQLSDTYAQRTPSDWDRHLVTLSVTFKKASKMRNPEPVRAEKILPVVGPYWRRILNKLKIARFFKKKPIDITKATHMELGKPKHKARMNLDPTNM